ncbi:MAG: hypothetical protein VXW58_14650 [Pseudomonadota bacterium]|nr:hypothetical protein [Pseudomonadota bacterium]
MKVTPVLAGILALIAAFGAYRAMTETSQRHLVIEDADLVLATGSGMRTAESLTLPLLNGGNPGVASGLRVPGGDQLNGLIGRGVAHGFEGFVYENRDRGHSTLLSGQFPALTFLRYGPKLTQRNRDYGLAQDILLPIPLIGNSSTAITGGPQWRSQTRAAMTSRRGSMAAAAQYTGNAVYFYPEHQDHDGTDMFPANWPYMVTSQGSSGSDQPFLMSAAMTLAAFRPETWAAMEQNGLIAPTLQMILRRNLLGVDSQADYLSGVAHPVVFHGKRLRPERMIAQAAAMLPDAIPPMVRLTVAEEDFSDSAGLAGLTERLFTTPSAIARLWRGPQFERSLTVSAGETVDPNGRDLTFHWFVVTGKARIEPMGDKGEAARLTLHWQDATDAKTFPPDELAQRRISRVDIAVVADNGVNLSAPAMISVAFPTHQLRQYTPDAQGGMQLSSIDYNAVGRGAPFDPVLFWSAPWVDHLEYDAAGETVAIRRQEGQNSLRITPDGSVAGGRIRHMLPHQITDKMELTYEIVPQD